jgi:hypothetical protein
MLEKEQKLRDGIRKEAFTQCRLLAITKINLDYSQYLIFTNFITIQHFLTAKPFTLGISYC